MSKVKHPVKTTLTYVDIQTGKVIYPGGGLTGSLVSTDVLASLSGTSPGRFTVSGSASDMRYTSEVSSHVDLQVQNTNYNGKFKAVLVSVEPTVARYVYEIQIASGSNIVNVGTPTNLPVDATGSVHFQHFLRSTR